MENNSNNEPIKNTEIKTEGKVQGINTGKNPDPGGVNKDATKDVFDKEQEINIIDLTVKALFNKGDKVELNLKNDILKSENVDPENDKTLDLYWDILLNTGLVEPVIGFGKSGMMEITTLGYNLMTKFGSYRAYLAQTQPPTTPPPPTSSTSTAAPPNPDKPADK